MEAVHRVPRNKGACYGMQRCRLPLVSLTAACCAAVHVAVRPVRWPPPPLQVFILRVLRALPPSYSFPNTHTLTPPLSQCFFYRQAFLNFITLGFYDELSCLFGEEVMEEEGDEGTSDTCDSSRYRDKWLDSRLCWHADKETHTIDMKQTK